MFLLGDFSRVVQRGLDILLLQVRIAMQDLLMGPTVVSGIRVIRG